MTFFCSKCRKRHDVAEISADMWSICKDKIKSGVSVVLSDLIDEKKSEEDIRNQLENLFNDLMRLINTPEPTILRGGDEPEEARVNAFFALNKKNLAQLVNASIIGGKGLNIRVSGTYAVQLGLILSVYERWENKNTSTSASCVPAEWYTRTVCQQDVTVFFTEKGVLDKVTDSQNVPFAQAGGQMLGFTHICPHCGCILSRASGAADEIVVALAGSPRAGKTSSMVAMFHSLLNDGCPGVRIIPMDHDVKWDNLKRDIEDYAKCVKVQKTPNDRNPEVPAYSVLLQVNGTQRVLTLVDMAGEFWESGEGLTDEFFRVYAGIYEHIDCIWFLISKATVLLSKTARIPEEVNEKLISDVSEDEVIIKTSDPNSLSENLSMLKKHLTKEMPPILVIVSKPDHMVSVLDEEKTQEYHLFPSDDVAACNALELGEILKISKSNQYYINQQPLRNHADNVRSFIKDACPPYITAIEDNCPDRFYVSLSPYGRPAMNKGDAFQDTPVPYHELVPFLWTMAIHGGMRVYQDVRWQKINFLGYIVSEERTKEPVPFYHARRRLPEGKGKDAQRNHDLNLVYATISNNLLMNEDKYVTETVIDHKRS